MSRCVGCGIKLQNDNPSLDGYVADLEHSLCMRCFMIKNYNKYKNTNKSNIDYLSIIKKIRNNDAVVYVSNMLTLNLDYIDKFEKIILVLTKRDILPKSVKDGKIINYIKKRYPNIIDVFVVSAVKKYNLDNLYSALCKYRNHDIYFVGATNSGKSTLINEMIKSYNGYEGNITVSSYPSTTLDVVSVKIGDLMVKDTPGILITDSFINGASEIDIKKINSKKEIKPTTIQIRGRGAILIDEWFRIEYETEVSSMTFYMANSIDIDSISLNNTKLKDGELVSYNNIENQDLVIEDIGFIKVTNNTNIKIFCKKKVYMYLRDKLI